jgi:hypothetical protein
MKLVRDLQLFKDNEDKKKKFNVLNESDDDLIY